MPFYVFEKDTKQLYSVSSSAPVDLPTQFAVKELSGGLDLNEWDTTVADLKPRPPRRMVSIEDFMSRFTELELQKLLGLSENQATANIRALSAFMKVTRVINLDGVIVQGGLDDLVNGGRISAQRKVELTADG